MIEQQQRMPHQWQFRRGNDSMAESDQAEAQQSRPDEIFASGIVEGDEPPKPGVVGRAPSVLPRAALPRPVNKAPRLPRNQARRLRRTSNRGAAGKGIGEAPGRVFLSLTVRDGFAKSQAAILVSRTRHPTRVWQFFRERATLAPVSPWEGFAQRCHFGS